MGLELSASKSYPWSGWDSMQDQGYPFNFRKLKHEIEIWMRHHWNNVSWKHGLNVPPSFSVLLALCVVNAFRDQGQGPCFTCFTGSTGRQKAHITNRNQNQLKVKYWFFKGKHLSPQKDFSLPPQHCGRQGRPAGEQRPREALQSN